MYACSSLLHPASKLIVTNWSPANSPTRAVALGSDARRALLEHPGRSRSKSGSGRTLRTWSPSPRWPRSSRTESLPACSSCRPPSDVRPHEGRRRWPAGGVGGLALRPGTPRPSLGMGPGPPRSPSPTAGPARPGRGPWRGARQSPADGQGQMARGRACELAHWKDQEGRAA